MNKETMALSLSLLYVLLLWKGCEAKYRMFSLDEGQLCNENKFAWTNSIRLGAGAAIIKLDNATKGLLRPSKAPYRCAIHVRSAPNFGLVVHVESMNLRQDLRHGNCIDTLSFGRDDLVPLFTLVKSKPYCGRIKNDEAAANQRISFSDPGGRLIIWLDLGAPSAQKDAEETQLSLVVTAYQKECGRRPLRGFKKCLVGDMCISQHYFCDKHVNCVLDHWPGDELECHFEDEFTSLETTTLGPPASSSSSSPFSSTLLPLLFVLLIFVGVLSLVVYLSRRQSRLQSACDQSLTLEELSRRRGNRRRRHLEDDNNLYVVVTTSHNSNTSSVSNRNYGSQEEEPPPSYNELFPNTSPSEVT